MFSYVSQSIQAKLIAVLLVMFSLLVIMVVLNFNTFGSLDASTPAVNQAGAQRMRTYKLAELAGSYYRSDEAERASIGREFDTTLAQFEAVQAGLANGDSDFNLAGTNSNEIRTQLAVVDAAWESYKEELLTVRSSDTVAQEALGQTNGSADSVFGAAASVVGAMKDAQVAGADIDQAGAQRMRAYKMAFLANEWVDARPLRRAESSPTSGPR